MLRNTIFSVQNKELNAGHLKEQPIKRKKRKKHIILKKRK